jgi:peptidylprolyl isomerase
MARAKNGDKVHVHFTGTLEDGSVFDSTEMSGEDHYKNFRGSGVTFSPMEIVLGRGDLMPKLEEAVIGLEPGQSVKVKIVSDDAFGPRIGERIAVIPRSDIQPKEAILESFSWPNGKKPPAFQLNVGDLLEVALADGTSTQALVTEMTDATLTIDANHSLAGKDLTFDIRLVGIL